MSKQQLTIEHLAPYLPYGLKYIDKDSGKAETMRSICTEIDLNMKNWGFYGEDSQAHIEIIGNIHEHKHFLK